MPIWNEREERLDREEQAQRQLERLQSTLNRAYKNVPFYQNLFQTSGIEPSQIESIAELAKVPLTGAAHFGDNYPYGLFAVPLREVVRIHTARGSGLMPAVSGYTRQDLANWRDLVARALTAARVSPNDILQIDLDPGLSNWGRDYKDGAEAIGAGVIPLTILPPEKQLMLLRDYRTSVLVTTVPGGRQLIHHLFRANLNVNAVALKTLILVGEPPDAATRAGLEEQLHVRTFIHYGLSEAPGPAIAFECEERNGLHVSEDHFLPEIVNPETGRVLPNGEEGELVLTTLTTRAFPLIRFRTGDRVRLLPEACPCGRTLRRIEWFPQLSDDLMVIRGVKVLKTQAAALLERALGYVPCCFRFFLRQQEMRDYLEVWLKVDERIFSDEIKGMEKLCERLSGELAQELGVPVVIRLRESGSFGPES